MALAHVGTLGPVLALLAACIFFAAQCDRFLTGGNFSLILQQVMVVGVIAIGQTLIILTAGFDLSCGMVMALGGIKIGRRSMDLLLVDFAGQARQRWSLEYRFADPTKLVPAFAQRLKDIRRKLGPTQRERVQGIGIAAPLAMGGWQQLLGFPAELAEKWQRVDLAAEVSRFTELPVKLIKDTAAACVAELVAGRGRSLKSYLYIFVDTFIGGGLVLDSNLRGGINGNAAAGLDSAASADERALQAPWQQHTLRWLDVQHVVIDGSCGRGLLDALLRQTETALARYSWEGVSAPRRLAGTIGSDARAVGGALLPLYANFAPDRDLVLKLGLEGRGRPVPITLGSIVVAQLCNQQGVAFRSVDHSIRLRDSARPVA